MASAAARLEDYRPPDYLVDRVELDVALDPERTIVASRLAIHRPDRVGWSAPFQIDGRELELLAIELDGKPLPPSRYAIDENGLLIPDVPARFELFTRVAIHPSANRSLSGLFGMDGKLATQCEPEGFRRITFFPDRPDILARYRVRLEADRASYPVLLSNGNRVDGGDLPGNRHWVLWDDPHPKPCYIFGMFAGDFARTERRFVTASGRAVQVAIHANADRIVDCTFAMEALLRSLEWDERTYGLEYDLETYNVVALEGWGGATENKGLNLFGASGIVAGDTISTDDEFVTIERIVGHEQFHNWTGNRVTCRDWFQLSLKEGLTRYRDQCFMECRLGAGPWRIEMVRALRRNQFPEDDGPSAHPVRPQSYVSIDNFYSATVYEKGAELVRMLATLLGEDVFRQGVRLYLQRHDGQAATVEDFLRAQEDASGRDLARFARWYGRAGRPTVRVEEQFDPGSRRYSLKLRQRIGGAAPEEPLVIPIRLALLGGDGALIVPERVLALDTVEGTVVFEDMPERPVPSLLRGFSAPVTLEMERDPPDLALLAIHDDDPFACWDAMQTLGIRTIRQMAADPEVPPPSVFIEAFGALLARRDDPYLVSELFTLPDEPVLSEGLETIPLDAHSDARNRLRANLALTYRDELMSLYEELSGAPAGFSGVGMRRLRNAALELLSAAPDAGLLRLMRDVALAEGTMTESFAALSALAHIRCAEREEALAGFFEKWKAHSTVVDKWFTAQALSRAPGAVDDIIALEGHPAFAIDNVARLMAYYGSFFRQNRIAFHDPSGKGYRFLADRLLMMDAMGRSGSAWVMPQMNQWRRYDPARQTLIRGELERIAGTEGISSGLRENVEAALG